MAMRSGLVFALGFVVVSGCYTYRPSDTTAVPQGREIQLRVKPAEGERVKGLLGLDEDFRTLRGTVENGGSPDTLYLSLSLERLGESRARPGLRALVPVPKDEIEVLGVNHLNRGRTLALVGVSAVVAAWVVKSQFGGETGPRGTDNPGGVDQALIAFIRIPW
jgi:hypothetical protein